MKKIYNVILNYNGYEDTILLLKSLPKLKAPGYQISTVIIDNRSTDDSVGRLSELIGQLKIDKLIENRKNIGFAKGNNVGIKYALNQGAVYILLLNNDTKIVDNFLPSLLKIDADIASPVVQFHEFKESKNWIYDYGGFINWTTGRTYHINKNSQPKTNNIQTIPVDYIAGCCMFIKRKVFETIGLLDEKYFIYFEDVDFCVTAKKKGFSVIVDPTTVIYHKLGGSMDRWSNRAIYRNLLGNFIFITKHLSWKRIIGYAYLSVLTAKIIRDRLMVNIKRKLKVT